MKLRELLLAVVFVAFAIVLPSCSVGSTGSTTYNPGPPVTLTVSPSSTISVPVNGVVTYSATTSSALPVVWQLTTDVGSSTGALTYPATANTAIYTAPATPPVNLNGSASPGAQGLVTLAAEAYNSVGTPTIASQTFAITNGNVTAGIFPATASLALAGGYQYFTGWAVGTVNNGVTFTVNGISGGSSAVGTISAVGLYQAPATMPMSGPTVTITCTSTADPTKFASAVVTLH
jgi:hypothetical protein